MDAQTAQDDPPDQTDTDDQLSTDARVLLALTGGLILGILFSAIFGAWTAILMIACVAIGGAIVYYLILGRR
jgi:hypothetical protein